MPLKNFMENHRLPLTWTGGAMVALLLLLTSSRWESVFGISAILFSAGMVLVGVGSLGRLWCAVYIAGYKDDLLVTEGPYAMCRNPLYLFSFIGALGVAFCTETLTVPGLTVALFALAYPAVIRSEEDRLAQRFSESYRDYRHRTPAFWPRIRLLHEPTTYIVNPRVFRRSMFDALWFVWLTGFLEIIEELHELGIVPLYFRLF